MRDSVIGHVPLCFQHFGRSHSLESSVAASAATLSLGGALPIADNTKPAFGDDGVKGLKFT